jgi:hypothetical protein
MAVTESTVQWLLHRRMNAQQQMRWSPRGAHLMLKVRTTTMNGTLERDHVAAYRWARRTFRLAASVPQILDVSKDRGKVSVGRQSTSAIPLTTS